MRLIGHTLLTFIVMPLFVISITNMATFSTDSLSSFENQFPQSTGHQKSEESSESESSEKVEEFEVFSFKSYLSTNTIKNILYISIHNSIQVYVSEGFLSKLYKPPSIA